MILTREISQNHKKVFFLISSVVILLVIALLTFNMLNSRNTRKGNATNLSNYYKYDEKCYQIDNNNPNSIGNIVNASQIERQLDKNLYSIKGVSQNKSIALFFMGDYYQLNYAFDSVFEWAGEKYSIDPVRTVSVNQFIGNIGDRKIFSSNVESQKAVVIEIKKFGKFEAFKI